MPVSIDGTNGITIGTSVLGTPSGSAPSYVCRAWVNFNGTGTVAIRASGNVSSITDIAVGQYRVNFTTAMQDINFAATATIGNTVNAAFKTTATPETTSAVIIVLIQPGVGYYDDPNISVAIFR